MHMQCSIAPKSMTEFTLKSIHRPFVAISSSAREAGSPYAFTGLVIALLGAACASLALRPGALGCAARLSAPSWLDAVVLLLWAPVVEEVALRAGLQRWLHAQWPKWSNTFAAGVPAGVGFEVALATAAFVAMHARGSTGVALLALIVPGAALAWVYARRRRLTEAIALHALFNASALRACAAWVAA